MIIGVVTIPCKLKVGDVIDTRYQRSMYCLNDKDYIPCGNKFCVEDDPVVFTKVKLIELYHNTYKEPVIIERYCIQDAGDLYPYAIKVFKGETVKVYTFAQNLTILKEALLGECFLHESIPYTYIDQLTEDENCRYLSKDAYDMLVDYVYDNRYLLANILPLGMSSKSLGSYLDEFIMYADSYYTHKQSKIVMDSFVIPDVLDVGRLDPLTLKVNDDVITLKSLKAKPSKKITGLDLTSRLITDDKGLIVNQSNFKPDTFNHELFDFFMAWALTDIDIVITDKSYKINYALNRYLPKLKLNNMLTTIYSEHFEFLLRSYLKSFHGGSVRIVKTFTDEVYVYRYNQKGDIIRIDYLDLLLVLLNSNDVVVWP